MTDPKLNLITKHRAAIDAKTKEISDAMLAKSKAIRDKVDLNDPQSVARGVEEVQAVIAEGTNEMVKFLAEIIIKELVIEPMLEMFKGGFAPGGEYRKDH